MVRLGRSEKGFDSLKADAGVGTSDENDFFVVDHDDVGVEGELRFELR